MNEVALYIHIPFCAKKCLYCDFPSFCGKDSLMVNYAEALNIDIINSVQDKTVSSIFIGGGTPTYLSLEAWQSIGKAIESLNKSEKAEFSVECNPGTITKEKLEFFKKIGVNRLSIGLQAWQDSLLTTLGRIHTIEEFIYGYELARYMGFNNINIDLMFGIPKQSLENWDETLNKVLALDPEHLSCYSLIVEEGTPFNNMFERNELNVPEENIEREMHYKALELMKKNNYIQYEISNFSKVNKQCAHNLVYWELKDYIGCGSSSHSYLEGNRYRNEENIEKYIELINKKKIAVVESHKNTMDEDVEEFMFMGLRKVSGISEEDFQKRFKKNIFSIYGSSIEKFISYKLLQNEGRRIFLTPRGMEISNTIMSEFLLSK